MNARSLYAAGAGDTPDWSRPVEVQGGVCGIVRFGWCRRDRREDVAREATDRYHVVVGGESVDGASGRFPRAELCRTREQRWY